MDQFNQQQALTPDATASLSFAPGSIKRVADLLESAENVIDHESNQDPLLNALEPTPIGPNVQVTQEVPAPSFDDTFLSRTLLGGMSRQGLLKSQGDKMMVSQQQFFQNSTEVNLAQRLFLQQQMQQLQQQMQAQPQMQQNQQFPFSFGPTSMNTMLPSTQTKNNINKSPVAAMLNASPRKSVGPSRKTPPKRTRKYQTGQWNERFEELLKFKQENGHLFVPHSYPANQKLAQWVKRQRYQYKLKQSGHHSTLSDDREDLLSNVGFIWDSHAAGWQEHFRSLEAFFMKHGHCNVPSDHPDSSLSVWSKHQRRQLKRFKSGLSSTMTEERFQCLESLAFDWNPRNLKNFKSK